MMAYRSHERDLEKVDPVAAAIEVEALTQIIRRDITPVPYNVSAEKQIMELDAAPNKQALKLAAQLVQRLSSHYAIVLPSRLGDDGRFSISYDCTVIPNLKLIGDSDGLLGWLKSRARVLLGARPVTLTLPLDNAWTTSSYHMFIHSEDGLYLASQEGDFLKARWSRV
jgi:hypothetical protein